MSNLKAKVSLLVVMLLIVSAFSVAFADDGYIMNLSVSYNGEALENNEQIELLNSNTNRTLTVTTDAKFVDESLTLYVTRSNSERQVLATGVKSATFEIPSDLREGYLTSFAFEAVANNFSDDYVGNSNGFQVKVACPKEEEVTVTANLEYNGKTIAHNDTVRVDEGDKLTISGTSNIGVKLVAYKWDNGAITEVEGTKTTIEVPTLGEGKRLSIVAQATDGKWSNSKTFTVLKKAHEDETEIEAILRVDGAKVNHGATIEVDEDTKLVVEGVSNKKVTVVSYKWGNGKVVEVNAASATIPVPEDLEDGTKLSITAKAEDGKWANSKTFTVNAGDGDDDEGKIDGDDDELIVEPWMRENDDLAGIAVSLRSEPFDDPDEKGNKNIYALGDKIVYYVDYKNGGKDIKKEVKLVLDLPLQATVVDADGGKVDKKAGTITWTMDGLEEDAAGTRVVVVKYTSLGSSKATYKRITPMATISVDGKEKDKSAVINLIVKDYDVEIKEEHDPYMIGDAGTLTFRPDDTITRAEGALVLTRIFGISTAYDRNEYDFPDLNETYLAARKAIRAARAYGLIEGFPDGNYYPNRTMTRGEFMTILAREIEEIEGEGFEVKEADELIKIYKDKNRIYYLGGDEQYNAHWAAGYATLLCRLNMAPVSEKVTNLRLEDPISRAEVTQLVNLYLLRAPAYVTKSTKTQFPDVSKKHPLFADIVEATRPSHTWSITDDVEEVEEDD